MLSLSSTSIWLKAEAEGRMSKAKEDVVSSLPWKLAKVPFYHFILALVLLLGPFQNHFHRSSWVVL